MIKHYLADALIAHAKLSPVGFHMPGHKYGKGLPARFLHMFEQHGLGEYDVTELAGLDVLHYPSGVINASQEQYARFQKVHSVHYLVNGSSAGIVAAMLAILNPDDTILVPRNCHSSVIHGLILTGAKPLYYQPELDSGSGLILGISAQELERTIKNNSKPIKAMILLNPNYYGICSDIREIQAVCKRYHIALIVDEAHGSLFPFNAEFPTSGLKINADIVVQSLHKTAGALTQCSIVCTGETGRWAEPLVQALRMLQTTSPSYILMASIEASLCELMERGHDLAARTIEYTAYVEHRIERETNVKVLRPVHWASKFIDKSRLLLSARHIGYNGFELARQLQGYNVFVEMADDNVVVLMFSWANITAEVDVLIEALKNISCGERLKDPWVNYNSYLLQPLAAMTPREAWFSSKERILGKDSLGKVAAQVYAPCPPGIPLLIPGEVISEALFYSEKFSKDLEIEVVAGR